jgi:TRAP-type C4-dicarboxylate transport system substrate-binding protein
MIDGLALAALYGVGFMPEGNGEWLPYNWKTPEEMMDIYFNYGFLDLMREAAIKHDIRYVAPLATGSMGLLTKFPVRKMEDLKGKKIKTAGMTGEIMLALGATPVTISQSEQYMALQRGTVDGTIYPWYPIETYKFFEVISHVILPAFHTPSCADIWLNGKLWNSLSSANKDAINRAGKEAMQIAAKLSDGKDSGALRFCKEKGVTVMQLTSEEQKRFLDVIMLTYETHAKKSALCARQVEIFQKY